MKNKCFLLIGFALLAAGCGAEGGPTPGATEPPAAAAPTAEPTITVEPTTQPAARPLAILAPNFVFQGDDPTVPILTHQPSAAIDEQYINPGAVLFHDGRFHMLFNSFTAWPGVVQVGYAQSEDGTRWQMVQDEPVFSTAEVPFGGGKADVSSALVLDDGTWVMYFHTVSSGRPPMVIGRATAASPQGPWQVDPEPVLANGGEGAWDELGVMWPSVGRDEDGGFWMYFGGRDATSYAIGRATSADGITWTKHDDPATSEAPYAESDPVLRPAAGWESTRTDRPRVQRTPDGWVMMYQGGPAVEERGLALSEDGLNWLTYPGNPIFDRDLFPIANAKTWDTTLVYRDGKYYYFMELGSLAATNLYLAVHEGPLRP